MRSWSLRVLASSLLALGCGSKQPPAQEGTPPLPPPSSVPGSTLTAEDCTAQGGEVRGDIGDGKIACREGEQELGRVLVGIEGSICCAPTPASIP